MGRADIPNAGCSDVVLSEGTRSGFLDELFFGGMGHLGQKLQIFMTVLLALPPSAVSPKIMLFIKICGFVALVPQASKKQLGPKTPDSLLVCS